MAMSPELCRQTLPQRVPGEAVWRFWNASKPFSDRSSAGRTPLRKLTAVPRLPSPWGGGWFAGCPLPKNSSPALGLLGLAPDPKQEALLAPPNMMGWIRLYANFNRFVLSLLCQLSMCSSNAAAFPAERRAARRAARLLSAGA